MKRSLLSVMLFSLSFLSSHAVFAANDVCTESFGVLHCGSGEIDNVFHLGNVFLSGTHITNSLSVTGNVEADNAEIGTLSVTGNVSATHLLVHQGVHSTGIFHIDNGQFESPVKLTGNIEGSHDIFNADTAMTGNVTLTSESFKSTSTITGKLSAELTTFSAPLTLNACMAELSQTALQQIQMTKQSNCPDDVEKLYLREKTIVNGNIVFPGGNGQVYLSKNSMINGQVSGGTITHI